jgi:hypothetical protein
MARGRFICPPRLCSRRRRRKNTSPQRPHSSPGACNRPGRAVAHLCVPDTRRSSTFPLCQSIFFACPCQRKPWMLFPDSPDLSPVFSRRAGPAHMPLAPWPTGLRRAHVMGQIPDAHRFPFRASYLSLRVMTTLAAADASSQYRLAALAFDRHISHLVRSVLPYFGEHRERIAKRNFT